MNPRSLPILTARLFATFCVCQPQILSATRSMTVRVLERDTQQPLPGAQIKADYKNETGFQPAQRLTTDDHGEAKMSLVGEKLRAVQLEAKLPGYLATTLEWDADTGEPAPTHFTLRLLKGIQLGGIVQNEAGQPIAGVKVRIPALDSLTFGPRERYEWGATGSKPVVTDTAGRWSFDGAPPDVSAATLEFEHPDYRRTHAHTQGASTSTGLQIALDDLKSAQASVTLKRRLTLVVSATDAATGTPLRNFVVTPGYASGRSVRWEARQARRTNRGQILFSPDDDSKLPSYVRAYAEGKTAHVVRVSSVPSGETTVTIPLRDGTEITGSVSSADGQPLANAQVALLTEFAGATLRQTTFLRTADLISTRTDSQGRYRFPSTPEAHTVVAVHEQGFAAHPLSGSTMPIDLKLSPWQSLRGDLTPYSVDPEEPLALFVTASPFIPRLSRQPWLGGLTLDINHYAVETNPDGTFAIGYVPPSADVVLWHTVKFDDALPAGEDTVCFNGRFVGAIGNDGTLEFSGGSLRGRLQSGDPDARIPWNATLNRVRFFPVDNPTGLGFDRLFTCNEAGLFRLVSIPAPGKYELTLSTFTPPLLLATARREIVIPPSNPRNATLDLGTWTVMPTPKPKVGDPAPPIEVTTFDGKKVRLPDLRGRYVLLHFWSQWCGARATSFPALQELYAAHANDNHLEILCLYDGPDYPRAVLRNPMPWPQGCHDAADQYPTSELPSVYVLDPEGRIVAADVSAAEAVEAIRKALER